MKEDANESYHHIKSSFTSSDHTNAKPAALFLRVLSFWSKFLKASSLKNVSNIQNQSTQIKRRIMLANKIYFSFISV